MADMRRRNFISLWHGCSVLATADEVIERGELAGGRNAGGG
jgi:hypothetical protein